MAFTLSDLTPVDLRLVIPLIVAILVSISLYVGFPAIERFLCAAGVGNCYRCKRPWNWPPLIRTGPTSYRSSKLRFLGVKEHCTKYSGARGCFPLCEGCWEMLTPKQRLPYYEQLIRNWQSMGYDLPFEYDMIRRAVAEGK